MKYILLIFLLLAGILQADNCTAKRFSLNAYQNHGSSLTLMDLLSDVAQTCNISVVFEDSRTRERLAQPLDMVNLNDYSLPELFSFIFDEHNLFYDYNPKTSVLKVSYYNTVNLNVDYINMDELTTQSVKSINVGVSSSVNNSTNSGTTTVGTNSSTNSSGSNNDSTTVTATSSFTFWNQLQEHIQQILKIDEEYSETYNKTLINRDATIVTVSGTKRQITNVEQYLAALKKRMHQQVMIEAHLIELTYNDYSSIGVNWSNFSLALNGSYTNSYNNIGTPHPVYSFGVDFNPTGLIDFLKQYGDVEVLSNPKVLTLSNQPAIINVGKQLSYLYQNGSIIGTTSTPTTVTNTLGSVFVGLTLNIIPEVSEDGYIIMRINPVSSELLTDSELSSSSSQTSQTQTDRVMPPDTRVKQMSSIVKVKDSQKVLIGGLIEKKNYRNETKVPLLGDIPLFGKLFHNTTDTIRKSELFILITPILVKQDVFPSIDDALVKRTN